MLSSLLAPVLYENSADGGAAVRFEDPDESARLTILAAPIAGAGELISSAAESVDACSLEDEDFAERLDWRAVGDAHVAFGTPAEPVDPGIGVRQANLLASVGDTVIILRLEAVIDDDSGLGPLLTDEDLQAIARDLAGRLEALR